MNELVVIVEGPTEQTFVRDQLAAHLAIHGVIAWPVLPGRNRRQGGVKKWEIAQQDIVRTLKEGRYCTTMFDYYALPKDWPARTKSEKVRWNLRSSCIEEAVLFDIKAAMSGKFDDKYFIPYVQLHEFEALTFADVEKLVSVVSPLSNHSAEILATKLSAIVDEAGDPEAIDDGYDTCPSRRISGIVPAYRKATHGPIVTSRIGIDELRQKCSHFAYWLKRLETIGS